MLHKMLGYEFAYMKSYMTWGLDIINRYESISQKDTNKDENMEYFIRYFISRFYTINNPFNQMVIFHLPESSHDEHHDQNNHEQEKHSHHDKHNYFKTNEFSMNDRLTIFNNLKGSFDTMLQDIEAVFINHFTILIDLLTSLNHDELTKRNTLDEILSLLYEKVEKFQNEADIVKGLMKLLIALFNNETSSILDKSIEDFTSNIQSISEKIPMFINNKNFFNTLIKQSISEYQNQIKNIVKWKFNEEKLKIDNSIDVNNQMIEKMFNMLIIINAMQGFVISNNAEFFSHSNPKKCNYSPNEIKMLTMCKKMLNSNQADENLCHIIKMLNFGCHYVKPSLIVDKKGIFTSQESRAFIINHFPKKNQDESPIYQRTQKVLSDLVASSVKKI